jgi:hypothetical protein
MIINSLIYLLINGSEKITFQFKETSQDISLEQRIKNYKAFCILEMEEDIHTIFENVEFRDKKKKKGMRTPEFKFETSAKYFTRTPEFNVLIYNKKAEFLIRNKIFEIVIKQFETITEHELEIETVALFLRFNELYEEVIQRVNISENILTFEFKDGEQQESEIQ